MWSCLIDSQLKIQRAHPVQKRGETLTALCVKTKSYIQRSHLQGHSVMFVFLQKWGGWAAPPLLPEWDRWVAEMSRDRAVYQHEKPWIRWIHHSQPRPRRKLCRLHSRNRERDINIVLIITSPSVRDSGTGGSIYSSMIYPMSTRRFWPSSKEEVLQRCNDVGWYVIWAKRGCSRQGENTLCCVLEWWAAVLELHILPRFWLHSKCWRSSGVLQRGFHAAAWPSLNLR